MDNIIEAEGLSKVYLRGTEKIHALREIDLSIGKGEFVSVVGPSGSGKTTLLNLCSCLDTATSGRLRINSKDVGGLPEKKLVKFRRAYMGFVFQHFFLLPTLTVYENVGLPLLFRKKRIENSKIESILKTIRLEGRADHLPSQLSGGEMQRVAIGRALINEPEIIFADEPTGNLDSTTGKDILHLFKNLNQSDITVVVVTHNQEWAEKADRVIYLLDGKVATAPEKNKTLN